MAAPLTAFDAERDIWGLVIGRKINQIKRKLARLKSLKNT
jgi:hypothetical protein